MSNEKSLGLVGIPAGTIEHDLVLLERFQEFSAELLRLALLGISAIGLFVSKYLFPENEKICTPKTLILIKGHLAFTLVSFGLCAAAALAHRYFASDSVSWHLQAMRRYQRNMCSDAKVARKEVRSRLRRFKFARYAIMVAALSLGIGAVALAAAVWSLIVQDQ